MNTARTFEIHTESLEATYDFAAQTGRRLKGGEVFELVGDLGAGKTAFVRGMASAFGVDADVSSPSFTISNVYPAGELTFYHYDLYRLDEPGLIANELAESIKEPKSVTFVEWGDSVSGLLPDDKVTINIQQTGEENGRSMTITVPASREYLFGDQS